MKGNANYQQKVSQGLMREHPEVLKVKSRVKASAENLIKKMETLEKRLKEYKKKLENKHTLLETNYQVIFNSANDMIFVHDSKTGAILDVNQKVVDVYGYSKQEFRKLDVETISEGKPPYTNKEALEWVKKAARGTPQIFEWKCKNRAGQFFWVEVNLKSVVFEEKKRVLAIVRDITERKQTEVALLESELRYRSLSDATLEGILIHNRGKVLEANRMFCDMFGYTYSELISKSSAYDLVAPESRQLLIKKVESKDEKPYEAIGIRKDGSTLIMEICAREIPYKGQMARVATVRDITERKHAERELCTTLEELERSNRELEEFAYVASHDLQEPLRMVASYMKLLERRYKGKIDVNADKFIAYAVGGAIRMQTLINDLLTYSRVGKRKKEYKSVNCDDVLEQVVIDLDKAIKRSMALVTHDPLPIIIADDIQIGQVLQNLISNAIKFQGNERPEVHISAEKNGTNWLFSVRDNGIGIDMKHAEPIFKIFQRLHVKNNYVGTGIGLAICKRVVERHGGRIWVESKEGKGSTFYFTIPVKGEYPLKGSSLEHGK